MTALRPFPLALALVSASLGAGAANGATDYTIHQFGSTSAVYHPSSGVMMDQSANLYVTLDQAGMYQQGAVELLSPDIVHYAGGAFLYQFKGGADGADPAGGVIMDSAGALYGTTTQGGTNNNGTVFKLTPPPPGSDINTPWTKTTLHSFTGESQDGASPTAGVIMDSRTGALYGATQAGGQNGKGFVFKLTPPGPGKTAWTFSPVFNLFGSNGMGDNPSGTLFLNEKTKELYGTTQSGGTNAQSAGVVYKLTPPAAGSSAAPYKWLVLHVFKGGPADGAFPGSGVVMDQSGVLYGSASVGGQFEYGVVFKLTPAAGAGGNTVWAFDLLHSFHGGDGHYPEGLLIETGKSGALDALYGTTNEGGSSDYGVVFKMTPPAAGAKNWTNKVLHSFTSGTDGGSPYVGPIQDSSGALYGTTFTGGNLNHCSGFGCGVVFKIVQ